MANADRLIELFNGAKYRPTGTVRDAYLAEECGDDAALKAQVCSLVDAHENAGGFLLTSPEFSPEIEATLARLKPEEAGQQIGPYKLREQIGEGGFGTVWVAEQQVPVRRTVALKIIKLGMDTEDVVARFGQERQALAMMDHPNIAKVIDAGATEWGRPFFVMELVRGIRITDYCDQANLPTVERLALFIQVCHAVQHAHQKGIIHRDLKPSNILVTLHDGVPVPKVIDFGVAKATQGRLAEHTVYTRFQQMVGTPLYMSPEQAEMNGLDVDTRTDIYALGVLLYELLTGRTPFDADALLKAGFDEMRRVIREQEPQKPSTALVTMAQAMVTAVAHHRASEPPKLIHAIRGDLDWIVMKSLEKDRARRYDTANGLAADLQRYLDNEPVIARPPSAGYRFQKLVRRNQLAFAAGTAIAAALVIGFTTATWMYFRESEARKRATQAEKLATVRLTEAEVEKKRAQSEALKSQQVAKFLKQIFEGANPFRSTAVRDRTLLKEILDRESERIKKDLAGQPEVQAELQRIMAESYTYAGEPGKAEQILREVLATRKSLGDSEVQLIPWKESLSDTLKYTGKSVEAESLLRECLVIRRRVDPSNARTAYTLRNLGQALSAQGKLEEAEAVTREALDIRRRLFGNENLLVADALGCLAEIVGETTRLDEAESLSRQSIAIESKAAGDGSLAMSEGLRVLSWILDKQGKTVEAITLRGKSLAMSERFMGPWHPWMKGWRGDGLKYLVNHCGFEEAEALLRRLLAEVRTPEPNGSSELGTTLFRLADVLCKRMKLAEARTLAEEAVALYKSHPEWPGDERRAASKALSEVLAAAAELAVLEGLCRINLDRSRASMPADHSQLAGALAGLTRTLLIAGKFAEAELLARECLIIREKQTPDDWMTFDARSMLGGSLLGQRKYAGAEPLLVSSYEGLKAREDKIPSGQNACRPEALQRIVQLYEAKDQPEKIAEWNKTLAEAYTATGRRYESLRLREEVFALRRKLYGPEDLNTLSAMHKLAAFYFAADHRDQAFTLYEELLPLWRKVRGPEHPDVLLAMIELASSYLQAGRHADALKHGEEALTLCRTVLRPENHLNYMAMNIVAASYQTAGRPDDALKLREDTLALCRQVLSPENPDTQWAMERLADSYTDAKRGEEALRLREEARTLRNKPKGPEQPNARATDQQAGQVDEALSVQSDASKRNPGNTPLAVKLAALQVWFEKETDHAATRQRMLLWATNTSNHQTAERVVKLTCLRPIDDAQTQQDTLHLARRAVEIWPEKNPFLPYAHMVVGMAEYRCGNYPAADAALTTAETMAPPPGTGHVVECTASFYRAMSLFQQGKKAAARELFVATETKMKPLPADEKNPLADRNSHSDHLILWLAFKEARTLLNAPPGK